MQPHQDGPAYYPVVAILSLGSPVVMDFSPHVRLKTSSDTDSMSNGIEGNISEQLPPIKNSIEDKEGNQTFSIILMPRSLLIFKDEAYSGYLHGISDCEMQRYDKAVNPSEIAKLYGGVPSSTRFQESVDEQRSEILYRTAPRVSLTCRVVTRVHKNLFKF
ncbi:oxygenase [Lithospermum erythrorhizon]|uniref:Oxygenase n=1 Tax=Lithospermum erythrorhizon TaxID=34254 RepID=A0AAV3Q958_LITER